MPRETGKHQRPGRETEALKTTSLGGDSSSIVTRIPTQLTHPKAVAPAYVVFTFDTDGAMVRRNVYLSLHSALKAKERAEKRGRRFEMILCELVPTPHKPAIVVGGAVG